MTGSRATSPATAAGSSSGASQTPTSPRAINAARRSIHNLSGTITGTPSGRSPSDVASRTRFQRSSETRRCLMSCGIHAFLERFDPDSLHGVDEALVLVPGRDVRVDQSLDDVGHLGGRERRADHLAERGIDALRAADRHLVPLGTLLV